MTSVAPVAHPRPGHVWIPTTGVPDSGAPGIPVPRLEHPRTGQLLCPAFSTRERGDACLRELHRTGVLTECRALASYRREEVPDELLLDPAAAEILRMLGVVSPLTAAVAAFGSEDGALILDDVHDLMRSQPARRRRRGGAR